MIKNYVVLISFFVITALILPVSVFFITTNDKSEEKNDAESVSKIKVYFHKENTTREMPIEEYLYGVVCAEMPATFETEALKAQAVAARSYALYRKNGTVDQHPDADVCTDFSHCKAYKTLKEAQNEWGDNSKDYYKKICNAVEETAGEIITYDGEIALAVFHSQTAGGRTENSSDVWGGNIPYLVSVESHGEENAPGFYSEVTVDFLEFRKKIKEKYPDLELNSPVEITEPVLSEGGNIKSITVGNKDVTGRVLRETFGLRSTCFKIKKSNEAITFEVAGYGHGVGMSQYGANAMAKEGFNYIEILTHYYSGTKIESV